MLTSSSELSVSTISLSESRSSDLPNPSLEFLNLLCFLFFFKFFRLVLLRRSDLTLGDLPSGTILSTGLILSVVVVGRASVSWFPACCSLAMMLDLTLGLRPSALTCGGSLNRFRPVWVWSSCRARGLVTNSPMSDTVNGFSGADWVGLLAGRTERDWAGVTNTETWVVVAAVGMGVVDTTRLVGLAVVVVGVGADVAVGVVVLRNAFLLL